MSAARRRRPRRGAWLAFLAMAVQLLLPFFLAAEIARASEPGGTAVICSALGTGAHHDSERGGDRHNPVGSCPICTALIAGHGFTTPAAAPEPPPLACARANLAAPAAAVLIQVARSFHQSTGPPRIA